MRHLVLLIGLAIPAAACSINLDADSVTVRDEKRFAVSGEPEISLRTFDGSIRVRSWEQPEILVEIEKHGPDRETAAALDVTVTQDGNRIVVEAPQPKVTHSVIGWGHSSPGVSLVVSLPRKARVTANTGDGSIVLAGVDGTINLQSGDGSIKAEDLSGRVTVESGDGSIHVDGRLSDLHAQTHDGSIVIEAADGSAMKSDWDVSTGDGSIVFRVPQAFSAEIDAHSGDGSVSAEGTGLERVQGDDDRESLRGRLGSGGHILKLRSGDGSIRAVNR
jgi:hypothetical protein